MNGEKETGVTTFFLTQEIDTGKIILKEKITIGEKDNAGKIHDQLMHIGAGLVCRTVDLLLDEKIDAVAQEQLYTNETELKPAPKIFKETCRIDWSKPQNDIYNLIRGLSPYPAAWSELCSEGKEPVNVKIYASEKTETGVPLVGGSIVTDNKSYIHVACGGGYIAITELQLPGKKMMKTDELLRGYKIEAGAWFK
jgi:methionyl-tRNA formyltransferase